MNHIADIMTWNDGIFSYEDYLPARDRDDAVFLLERNKKEFVWNTLTNFEGIPITLAQTEIILDGTSVSNVSISDLLKVKRFGDAVEGMISLIHNDGFAVNKQTVCALHSAIGKDEIRHDRGMFRTREVGLNRVNYKPRDSLKLDDLWNEGCRIVNGIGNTLEKACAMFLFMSRSQFFEDCNKRTALLMANGILINGGLQPFLIPRSDRERFLSTLTDFYETGFADDGLLLLREYATGKPPSKEENENTGPSM